MNIEKLRELLAELDALSDEIGDEDFDDLSAEFEDALFMLSEMDEADDDAPEEFEALCRDLRRWPEAAPIADRLEKLLGDLP